MFTRLYSLTKKLTQTLWNFIGAAMLDQVMVSGVSFFVGFYLVRHLGINQFGQFSLILIISYFCLEVQRAMVISPMMTLMARNESPDYLPQLAYLQIFFNFIISVLAAAFVFASGYLFPKWGIGDQALLTLFIIFARLQQEFPRRIFFVQNNARRALLLDAITFSLILGSVWMLVHTERLSLSNVLWWHVAAYLCPSFLAMAYIVHPKIKWVECVAITREHLFFGRWLVGGTIVQFFSTNWLIMISGAMLGASTVGLIKSAQYLLGGITMLFQAMENVVPLRLARLYHKADATLTRRFLLYLIAFIGTFTGFYVVVMMYMVPFFSDYLNIVDKPLFYNIAMGLIWQSFLFSAVLLLTYILRAKSLTKPIFYTHALSAFLTVTLAPAAIRLWHEMAVVYGIAIIQIIAIICFSLFIMHVNKRHG